MTLHLICVHSTENRRQESWNNVFVEFTKHKHCRKHTLHIIGYCASSEFRKGTEGRERFVHSAYGCNSKVPCDPK